MSETLLESLIDPAIAALHEDLARELPLAAPAIEAWISTVTGGAGLRRYFLHPAAFPTLRLPLWYEAHVAARPDRALQGELVASSIAGYAAIRLIDDVMDRSAKARPELLPVVAWLFHRFEAPYHRRFAADHPFWVTFRRAWSTAADVTAAEPSVTEWDRDTFESVSAGKVGAAWIPVAAVAWTHTGADPSPAWRALCERLFAWHQLTNDVFDWARDHRSGQTTWVQAEAARSGRPMLEFMAEQGLAWGFGLLRRWAEEIRERARQAHADGLVAWIDARRDRFEAEAPGLMDDLAALRGVLAAVSA